MIATIMLVKKNNATAAKKRPVITSGLMIFLHDALNSLKPYPLQKPFLYHITATISEMIVDAKLKSTTSIDSISRL